MTRAHAHALCVKYMSGITVKKFWHMGNYTYPFYRFVLEDLCCRCFAKSSSTMLDAGCGPNISSLSHVPENVHCIGIDISSENIAKSHGKAKTKDYRNFSFIVASTADMPFCSKSFDLILCCDVLEHVEAKHRTIQEISRVCRPQGKFVGSTSNLFNPLMLLDSFLPKKIAYILSQKFAGEHYERHQRMTSAGLVRALIEAGFKKCRVMLLGFPSFKPWIYEFSDRKLPWFAFFWIAFDSLTNRKQLRLLKDTIVFFAMKN